MKSLGVPILLTLVLSIAGAEGVSGQSNAFDRGSVLIGGEGSLTFTKDTFDFATQDGQGSRERTELIVAPSVEYFLIPGLALGGRVSIRRQEGGTWSLGGGPALRYFFLKGEQVWSPYLSGSLEFGKTWLSDYTKDPNFHSYRGAVGTVFMVSTGVGIHTEAFYDFLHWNHGIPDAVNAPDREDEIERREYGLAVGISVFVF